MSDFAGEYLGTLVLIVLGNGAVAAVVLKGSKAAGAGWLSIIVAWGLAVTMAIYTAGSFSGAHLNPAVTLAIAYAGGLPWHDVPVYLLAQFMGAFSGAVIVWIHYFPHWKGTADSSLKLAAFCTSPAISSPVANFVSEVIATMIFILGLMFIGVNKFTEGLKPRVVGALVMAIGLSFGGTTGFAINPARDLGPRAAYAVLPVAGKGSAHWGYAWVPVLGPLVGGLLGAVCYGFLFR